MNSLAIIISVYKNDILPRVIESISSILEQTYQDQDIYIQLDGTVRQDVEDYLYSLQYEHFFVFKREQNKGLAYSLNELLTRVLDKGYEYIARMDADDISMPERMKKQVEFLNLHQDVDCVGTWAIEIRSDGDTYFHKKMPITHDECLHLFEKRDCLIHPSVMFRKTYFAKAGLYPEDTYFGEDTMMWAKGFKAGCRFANIPEYLLRFRLDDKFFERRRGWKHAKSILTLRHKVNKMLGFGISADFSALLYAFAKMMPKSILSLIYKIMR